MSNRKHLEVKTTMDSVAIQTYRVTIGVGMTGSLTGSAAQATISGNIAGFPRGTDAYGVVLSGTQNPALLTIRTPSGSYYPHLLGYYCQLSCSDQRGQWKAEIVKLAPDIGEYQISLMSASMGAGSPSPTVPVEVSLTIIARNTNRRS